ALSDACGQPLTDRRVIGDAGFGNVNGSQAFGVRLKLAQALAVDDLAAHPVGLPALVKRLQLRQLRFIRRNDDLAAEVIGDAFALTEGLHRLLAGAAVRRLE